MSAVAFSLGFNACEQHPAAALPPHYQHKAGDHHDPGHAADPHGKPGAAHAAPGAGEKKAH